MVVIGCTQLSVSYVIDNVKDKYRDKFVFDSSKKIKNSIIVVRSVNDLVKSIKNVDKSNNILFFESKEIIDHISKNLNIIVCNSIKSIHKYIRIKNKDSVKVANILNTNSNEYINSIIVQYQENKILHRYNKLVYSTVKTKRNEIRKLILKYLFGQLSKKQFVNEFSSYLNSKKISEHWPEFFNYIDGDKANELIVALKYVKKRRFSKNIDYIQVSRDYKVDSYELQYLCKSYIELFM